MPASEKAMRQLVALNHKPLNDTTLSQFTEENGQTQRAFFFSCYGDHRDLHSFPTRRSSDLGRAGLLLAMTVAAAAGSAAIRRRLPATGEALAGLALALLLVDWYAARRAGLAPGWSATAWWALGSATGAAVALAAARQFRLLRVAAAALAQV